MTRPLSKTTGSIMLHGIPFRSTWQEKCPNYATISFRSAARPTDGSESRSRTREREGLPPRAKLIATFEPFTALERARTRRAENRDRISAAVPSTFNCVTCRDTFERVRFRSR